MNTQLTPIDTASRRLAVCIGLAFAILAGLMSLGAPTASALSNNPAECHNPRNAGSVWGSTSNSAVMRFDPSCDQVWVKITQKVAEDNRVYIVGYTCSEAKASCRGDSQGLKLRQGNRYSYSVSLSDHAAFRLCWSPKVTTGPFTFCTPAITLGSSSSAPSTKKPTSSPSSSSSTASASSTTKNSTASKQSQSRCQQLTTAIGIFTGSTRIHDLNHTSQVCLDSSGQIRIETIHQATDTDDVGIGNVPFDEIDSSVSRKVVNGEVRLTARFAFNRCVGIGELTGCKTVATLTSLQVIRPNDGFTGARVTMYDPLDIYSFKRSYDLAAL